MYLYMCVCVCIYIHMIFDRLQNVYFLIKLSFLFWYFLGNVAILYRISMHGWYMYTLFIFVFILFISLFSSQEPQHLSITTGFLSGIFLYACGRFLTRSFVHLKLF